MEKTYKEISQEQERYLSEWRKRALYKNQEGYHDPTAYHGTKNIIRDEDEQQKRVNTLIFVLKYITRLAGFELLNRIEIKDRKTGREYR